MIPGGNNPKKNLAIIFKAIAMIVSKANASNNIPKSFNKEIIDDGSITKSDLINSSIHKRILANSKEFFIAPMPPIICFKKPRLSTIILFY